VFHGRSADEVALASAAIVLALVQRLEKKGTLKREDALALLGDAADRLVADPAQTTIAATGAADLIRTRRMTLQSQWSPTREAGKPSGGWWRHKDPRAFFSVASLPNEPAAVQVSVSVKPHEVRAVVSAIKSNATLITLGACACS
jgi:hypothetical protein